MALVVDTGPLYAIYDSQDSDHARCRAILEATTEELILPAPVIPEFDFLASRRKIPLATVTLLDDILAGAFTVVTLTTEDHLRCRELIAKYVDSDIGFVDSAVLAIVERLKEPKLATLDGRHFRLLRPKHVPALQLLPG